ncbi:MAG: hypothetical protein DHS20C18_03710 [Saprospiraceae bacterium]|nr:MAG: hypothetical protein DHS20C18_03710 [Saprospiraceae bacterium]
MEVQRIGIDDATLIDQMMYTVPGIGKDPRDFLQRQSVKPYMMPVRKVGFRGKDLSYALAMCLEFYVNLDKNFKVNLSPDYISLNLEGSGKKINVPESFTFLVNEGTVSAAIMPYDASAITGAVYATQKFQINNYLHIFRELTKDREKIFETRKALMRGNPVIVDLKTSSSLKSLDSSTWKPQSGNEIFPLVVIGFDENQEAFEVLSCWGRNWGDGGYAWIKYSDFSRYATNGYVMVPQEKY